MQQQNRRALLKGGLFSIAGMRLPSRAGCGGCHHPIQTSYLPWSLSSTEIFWFGMCTQSSQAVSMLFLTVLGAGSLRSIDSWAVFDRVPARSPTAPLV